MPLRPRLPVSKIIDVKWFSGRDTIGIVLTQDERGEHKAYIGCGNGWSEEADTAAIAATGSPFCDGPKLWPEIKLWRT